MERFIWFYLALMILLFPACGKDNPTSTDSPIFTGTFSGTETGTQNGIAFTQTVTVTMTQTGSTVAGTYTTSSGSTGSIYGTVVGNSLQPLVFTSVGACPGSGSGTATLNGSTLTGPSSGTFGACGVLSATLSLNKK